MNQFELIQDVNFKIMLFGGPSVFLVKQDVITDYTYDESYPYDDASFRAATITTTGSASKRSMGFNAGGDIALFFTRYVGVGATWQFARAMVEVPGALGSTHEIKVGGSQAGIGLRLRF